MNFRSELYKFGAQLLTEIGNTEVRNKYANILNTAAMQHSSTLTHLHANAVD